MALRYFGFVARVPQALVGAGTALCAFLIGRQIFNATVGLFACAITAFYPYNVMYDTGCGPGVRLRKPQQKKAKD
jgi:4-amino-4-deoxy-L-arabinose transferase-like glycosyltransferase